MYLLAGIAGIILTVLFFVCVGNSCNIVLVVDKKSKYIIYANYTDANSFNELVKELEKNTEGLKKFSNSKKFNKYYAQQLAELGVDANSIVFENAMFKDYQVVVAKYAETSSIPSYITIDSLEQYKRKYNEATEKIKSLESELTKNNGKTQVLPKSNDEALKSKYESLLNEVKTKNKDLEEQLKKATSGKVDESVKEQLAAAEKLKKKIKDLEDELEEAQDDAEKFEKKFKNEEKEVRKLEDDVAKLNKEKTQLESDWKDAVEQLHDTEKELDLKMKSLSFVQEVLTAPKTKDSALDELHDKVDDVADYIRSDFYDCVTTLFQKIDAWDYYFGGGLSYWEAVSCKKWIQGKTTIAFVGEFSAGKTSIVNRVLSQDQPDVALLPVSAKATTAIPTYITGGVGTSYNFVSADQSLKTIRESTFKEVSKEVLGQISGISSLIKYFVMQYKNPYLDKISILDTPGFNSNDSEDANRTIEVINECDALFWVIDVNAGSANRTSLKLIHDNLQKPLYVIINKIDTKAKSEVDKVEQLLRKQFTDAGIQVVQYVRFSGKEPLSVIMNTIKSVPQNTNEDYLEYLTGTFIPNLISVYDKDVKEASQAYQAKEKEAERINNQFRNVANVTQNRCNEANSIIVSSKTDRILFDNIYKLSLSQGDRLRNLLHQISNNDIDDMKSAFSNSFDAAQEVQQSYANYCEIKADYQRITDCTDQLKKRINAYKTFIRKV